MAGGFAIDIEQLRKHATATDQTGGRADVAHDAGSQVADMDQAYGVLCRPIAWLLKGPQDKCAEAIGASAEILHQTSQKLDQAAKRYEEAEEHVTAVFGKILEELEAVPPVVGSPSRGR